MIDKTMKQFIMNKKSAYFRWIIACVLFLLISWWHMGPSLTHCSTVVLGSPGDHTAGIMYASWAHPSSPKLGFTNLTNYPYGENLWQPLDLSALVPSTLHLVLSHITNIVCAWNLLVLIGYMSSALVMFGFMYWLTKNSWVSFFAGYAATFTPYHMFASHGQIALLLGAIFTLALWQFLDMWRKPTWLRAVMLGATFGVGFYTDGYFILFGAVMLMALWIASISYGLIVERGGLLKIKPQLKCLILASITAFIFLLPLGWANHHYASQINSVLASGRGVLVQNAQLYSAHLYYYFKPTSILFLGFSVVLLAFIEVWFMWRDYHAALKQPIVKNPQLFVGWTALVLALFAMWVSLQPVVHVWRIPIYNPSRLIIALTPAWRVFGRLYTLVDIGFVTLAGLGLLRLLRKYPKRRYWIFFICLVVLAAELRLFTPLSYTATSFNYRNAPAVYRWLHNNHQVRAVAEYPLDEPPNGPYIPDYNTFQEISDKPLLNTLLSNSPEAPLRQSIVGINDPQTLPVLRALGVDLVNIRPADPVSLKHDIRPAALNNKGLERIFSYKLSNHPIDSFLVKPGPTAHYALVIPTLQYLQIKLNASGGADYAEGDDPVLSVFKLPNAATSPAVTIAFNISADSERNATIIQNGTALWSGTLSSQTQSISLEASPNFPITISNQKSSVPAHMTISKLQVVE